MVSAESDQRDVHGGNKHFSTVPITEGAGWFEPDRKQAVGIGQVRGYRCGT